MKLIPWDAQIIFLNGATIGSVPRVAPQVRFFDVSYTRPIIVGFHVIGDTSCPTVGFYVVGDAITPAVGFCVIGEALTPTVGFCVIGEALTPAVGFYVINVPEGY